MPVGKSLQFDWVFAVLALGGAGLLQLQTLGEPHVKDRVDEAVHHPLTVVGRRGDAQALRALGHSRVVDGLDVDAVLHQQVIGEFSAELCFTHLEGKNTINYILSVYSHL